MAEQEKKEKTKIVIKGSLLLNAVLGIAVVFLSLMLASRSGCFYSPPPPDTSSVLVVDTSGGFPDTIKHTGKAKATRDTVYQIDTLLFAMPEWQIGFVDYQNASLKIVAIKPLRYCDSFQIYSSTYFAPGGFRIRVDDSIHVDTFPHPPPPYERPSKIWHWTVEAGFDYVSFDSTIRIITRPVLAVGGELGTLRLGRTLWILTPLQLKWIGGGSGFGGTLAASCKLTMKF